MNYMSHKLRIQLSAAFVVRYQPGWIDIANQMRRAVLEVVRKRRFRMYNAGAGPERVPCIAQS